MNLKSCVFPPNFTARKLVPETLGWKTAGEGGDCGAAERVQQVSAFRNVGPRVNLFPREATNPEGCVCVCVLIFKSDNFGNTPACVMPV